MENADDRKKVGMSVATQPISAEAFGQLPENDMRRELIGGVVHERMLPGGVHGIVVANIAACLYGWLDQHGHGANIRRTRDAHHARDPSWFLLPGCRVVWLA
jgi:Uma2 family endonuclease